MGYPSTLELAWGEEKHTSTKDFAGCPLGTRAVLPDGRVFRYALAGEAITGAGYLVQDPITAANHDMDLVIPTSWAVGDTSVIVTLGATAAAANLYKDGYVYVNDGGGEGHFYRIKSHAAVASAGNLTAVLQDDEKVIVATVAGTSLAGLKQNPYNGVLLYNTTPDGVPRGVATRAIASGSYAWVQTWGDCAALINGTVVLGKMVTAGLTTSGSIDTYPITLVEGAPNTYIPGNAPEIGWVCNPVAVTTQYGHIFLMIMP